jgi:hypothetical protein
LSREIFTGRIADYASKSCIHSIMLILLTSVNYQEFTCREKVVRCVNIA